MDDRSREDDPYSLVRQAIAYLSREYRDQPETDDLARALGVSADRLRRVFRDWAGLTPKSFLQAVTLDHAKRLLEDGAPVLDTALDVGLSGPGRLHDLFVSHEAIPPGAYRARGAGLTIRYGYHPSPFGTALLMVTDKGLAGLAFCDAGEETAALEDMTRRWPAAHFQPAPEATAATAARIFDRGNWQPDQPLRIVMIGSDFEVRVWETLLRIPLGRATTYATLARSLGKPRAARAVGSAVGRNPISFVVPCHRVLGAGGALTGYHWGVPRKRAILGWEAGIAGFAAK